MVARESTARVRKGLTDLRLDTYLQLVDATGRIVRNDKRGSIPADLLPILDRLEIDAGRWIESLLSPRMMFGTAIGSASSLAREAARRGCRWVVNACTTYRDRDGPALRDAAAGA